MREILIITGLWTVCWELMAQPVQSLSLEDSYQLAVQHYPLARQKDLIAKSMEYSIANAQKGYLPQLSVSGQATYQSDVTGIPISFPGVDIPKLSKDQYKVYGEVSQVLYDGGAIRKQKQLYEANAGIDQENLVVELYNLRERINQLFFGILLVDKQLGQIKLRKSDIQAGLDKTNGAIANGTAFKSSADILHAELLQADQMTIEQKALRRGYAEMLGLFIDRQLDESTVLIDPVSSVPKQLAVNRPELAVFNYQLKKLDLQEQLIAVKNQPRVSLFLQGGYGKPALNLLKNEFSLYAIGGLRFNWSLAGVYTNKGERLLVNNSRRSLDVQKETFLFNTGLALKQEETEIDKLRELMETDDDIIGLRTSIKNTSKAQLENGVITSSDYLREVNAENQARQNFLIHQVQLLYAQYKVKVTSGN